MVDTFATEVAAAAVEAAVGDVAGFVVVAAAAAAFAEQLPLQL